jgi:hypothetical protein
MGCLFQYSRVAIVVVMVVVVTAIVLVVAAAAGDRGVTVFKVLCYKSEGCWFDPR